MVGHNVKATRSSSSAQTSWKWIGVGLTRLIEESIWPRQKRTSRKLQGRLILQYHNEDKSHCTHRMEASQTELRRRDGSIYSLQGCKFSSKKLSTLEAKCVPVSLWTCFRLLNEWWRDPDAGLVVLYQYMSSTWNVGTNYFYRYPERINSLSLLCYSKYSMNEIEQGQLTVAN